MTKVIPTGWKVIDEILNGGMPTGKLAVWIAGPGGTKSWHLMHLGTHAVKLGYKVLHYTMELDEIYVGKRYDCILTGIRLEELQNNIPHIKTAMLKYSGNLVIKFFPTKSIGIFGLKNHIDKTILNGFRPDLIIIDYADLLKLSNNSNHRKDEQLQELYEELRGLAGELNIPIHTASQINRSQVGSDVIGGDAISESFGKMFTSDFVASISRKPKDKLNNTGRLHVIKNRMGPDGLVFPEKIDTSHGIIEMYAENSKEGREIGEEAVAQDQYIHDIALRRMTEIFKTNQSSSAPSSDKSIF